MKLVYVNTTNCLPSNIVVINIQIVRVIMTNISSYYTVSSFTTMLVFVEQALDVPSWGAVVVNCVLCRCLWRRASSSLMLPVSIGWNKTKCTNCSWLFDCAYWFYRFGHLLFMESLFHLMILNWNSETKYLSDNPQLKVASEEESSHFSL
jgi:hypothetical protein